MRVEREATGTAYEQVLAPGVHAVDAFTGLGERASTQAWNLEPHHLRGLDRAREAGRRAMDRVAFGHADQPGSAAKHEPAIAVGEPGIAQPIGVR